MTTMQRMISQGQGMNYGRAIEWLIEAGAEDAAEAGNTIARCESMKSCPVHVDPIGMSVLLVCDTPHEGRVLRSGSYHVEP